MITRDTNDELLLMMLFLGLRRFRPSFTVGPSSAGFPSPNTGAVTFSFDTELVRFALLMLTRASLTPDVGGVGTVARGLGLTIGASEG